MVGRADRPAPSVRWFAVFEDQRREDAHSKEGVTIISPTRTRDPNPAMILLTRRGGGQSQARKSVRQLTPPGLDHPGHGQHAEGGDEPEEEEHLEGSVQGIGLRGGRAAHPVRRATKAIR